MGYATKSVIAGAEVLRLRTRMGLTQGQLAAELGMHHDTISNIERGRYRIRAAALELLRIKAGTSRKPLARRR